MILYICETCGRWQDIALGAAIVNAWNNAVATLKVDTHEKSGVPCPVGHGLMRMVSSDDRLKVWKEWDQETDHVAINTEPTPETHATPGRLSLVDKC